MTAPTRDFHKDLAFGLKHELHPNVIRALKRFYPEAQSIQRALGDRHGIDLNITLPYGPRFGQVKTRSRDFTGTDVVLEWLFSTAHSISGWMERSCRADVLLIHYLDSGRVEVFPWPQLKLAWDAYKHQWLEQAKKGVGGFKLLNHTNIDTFDNRRKHTSMALSVPVAELWKAMGLVKFGK